MKEKLSSKITMRFSEKDMKWLIAQAKELEVEISNIVRFAIRRMKLEGGIIHINPVNKEKDITTLI